MDEGNQDVAFGTAEDVIGVDALAVALQERSASSRGYLLSGDEVFLQARQSAVADFDAHLARLRTRHRDDGLSSALSALEVLWRRLDDASDRAVAAVRVDAEAAVDIWESEARPLQAEATAQLERLQATQHAQFEAARASSLSTARMARRAFAAIAAAVVLALGWLLLQLARTVRNLSAELRGTDLVVRWGGEEFVVVLPNTDLAGARAALDKALAALRRETFTGAEHQAFQVTFSCGVVQSQPGESLDSALARADALLYRAKREGRNRIATEAATA